MDYKKLITCSHDVLTELHDELNLTAALAVFTPDYKHGVVLSSIGGGKVFSFVPQVGYEFPLHASGPGKALLAGVAPGKRKEVVDSIDLTGYTEATISDQESLLNVLSDDKRKGYSTDAGELVVGINCVSSAVHSDNISKLAAIWVTAPSIDLPEADFPAIGKKVKKAAHEIEGRLTGRMAKYSYMEIVVNKAIKQMKKELSTHLDIEKLATDLNVGYDWFRKKFKKITGESPNSYHTGLRIEKAKELLVYSELSIKEIALYLGYETQNYFSAFFKKKTGLSPIHYREKAK